MEYSKSSVNVIKSVVENLSRETLIEILKKLIDDSDIVEDYITNVFLDAGVIKKVKVNTLIKS